ncbi:MAG: PadR family transcriptional regulator [Anaerolineae bacterium]
MPGRGWGRRGGPRPRWGRRMRIVEPMVLLLVAQEPDHGYRLVDRLGEDFGISALPPQTIYRALQQMEESGWITASWDMESTQGPPRKVYEITEAGEAALAAWSEEIESLRAMLDIFLESYRRFRED